MQAFTELHIPVLNDLDEKYDLTLRNFVRLHRDHRKSREVLSSKSRDNIKVKITAKSDSRELKHSFTR